MRRAFVLSSALVVALATTGAAQDSPSGWLKRIFDPAEVGVEPYPGSSVNRKVTTDMIRLDKDPRKEIAIYIALDAEITEVAAHFEKELGVEPTVLGSGTEFDQRIFDLTGEDAPEKLRGLEMTISKSRWVTGKTQILMEYVPPEGSSGDPSDDAPDDASDEDAS